MTVVVISVPSAGVVKDGKLTEEFLQKSASFVDLFRNISFINPMIEGYALLPYLKDPTATWEVWGAFCERLILVCDELWVLQFEGWETSKGVNAEIELARKYGKKICYFRA